jgi:DNA polymerase|tara:strand:- start:39871 stop:40761 length:891 start_codon:yes stop_codon:yes gene_type:complete
MSDAIAIEQAALIGALEFHIDSGVRDFCMDGAEDMYAWGNQAPLALNAPAPISAPRPLAQAQMPTPDVQFDDEDGAAPLGKAELIAAAHKALESVESIDALKAVIAKFDGLSIQKTASNIVFAEGDVNAPLMIINEIPQNDEDLSGKPFAGATRQIIDYALQGIGLSSKNTDECSPNSSVYMSSLLNWRLPGNRSPQAAEIAVSRIFLEKHIALAQPKLVLLLGNTACKTMLECKTNINKLRGNWQTLKYAGSDVSTDDYLIMPSFHPSALAGSAKNKKLFWQDMLAIKNKLNALK